ncbi:MAG: HDIG domain-containing protein [Nitrospirae bacterium]|nr:HDIG domain-containing protein [Nitrospirota bacterium]
MEPLAILDKYYYTTSNTYNYLITHSRAVADKALKAAEKVKDLNPDMKFIEEASLLHDIGIFKVNALKIGCIGPMDYVAHGYLGREIMDAEGYPQHALVCERHVGAGIAVADIEAYNLPLPKREMLPVSIEEQIICYADKFFSKFPTKMKEEKTVDQVRAMVSKYGDAQLTRFDHWHDMFGG